MGFKAASIPRDSGRTKVRNNGTVVRVYKDVELSKDRLSTSRLPLLGDETHRFEVPMADGRFASMKILKPRGNILYLSACKHWHTWLTQTSPRVRRTNDTRSGSSHSPDRRNSRTLPLASQGKTSQYIRFLRSSTNPMIVTTLGWDSPSTTRSSLTNTYKRTSVSDVISNHIVQRKDIHGETSPRRYHHLNGVV